MKVTAKGSPNGRVVLTYEAGKYYDSGEFEVGNTLCKSFVASGLAEEVNDDVDPTPAYRLEDAWEDEEDNEEDTQADLVITAEAEEEEEDTRFAPPSE